MWWSTGSRVAICDGLVLKKSMAREGRSSLRFALRRSRSRRVCLLVRELAQKGVATPRTLAWATVRRHGLRTEDYLLSEELMGCRRLTEYLEGECPVAEQRELLGRVGALLASFHVAGASNRDMKDCNVLITREPTLKAWAVDFDGVRVPPHLTRRRAARDFRSVVRFMKSSNWWTEANRSALQQGYNALVPRRLRRDTLPEEGEG